MVPIKTIDRPRVIYQFLARPWFKISKFIQQNVLKSVKEEHVHVASWCQNNLKFSNEVTRISISIGQLHHCSLFFFYFFLTEYSFSLFLFFFCSPRGCNKTELDVTNTLQHFRTPPVSTTSHLYRSSVELARLGQLSRQKRSKDDSSEARAGRGLQRTVRCAVLRSCCCSCIRSSTRRRKVVSSLLREKSKPNEKHKT